MEAPRFLHAAFGQALVLVAVAFVLGVLVNGLRPVPVPLGDVPAFEMLPHLSLGRAYKELEGGDALFVDARATEFFQQGHILNAVSVPLKSPEALVRETIPLPVPFDRIIVYCEEESCDAADAMARRLKRLGYDKIYVLEGGWRAWTQANLPTS